MRSPSPSIGNRQRLRYFDTFTGMGGFTVALSELGHECIGFSEIDKYASAVYARHFPSHHPYGDITKIDAAPLPDFDLLVGGFPCQAFSVAGKRRGFADTRGTLFFDLARILQGKRPSLFVFENVKGLLSHDGGRTFKTIIAALDELGYDVQWQVLNSRHFGVPQNRERVFIVGHLRGQPRPEVFPLGNSEESTSEAGNEQSLCAGTISTKNQSPQCQFDGSSTLVYDLKATDGSTRRGVEKEGYTGVLDNDCAQAVMVAQNQRRELRVMDVAGALPTTQSRSQFQVVCRSPSIIDASYAGREPRVYEGVSPTLLSRESGGGHIPHIVDGIRRLTPVECERLQGFPDNWTAMGTQGPISDTQRYKMCGNAVTVNVVREIVRRLP